MAKSETAEDFLPNTPDDPLEVVPNARAGAFLDSPAAPQNTLRPLKVEDAVVVSPWVDLVPPNLVGLFAGVAGGENAFPPKTLLDACDELFELVTKTLMLSPALFVVAPKAG